jgi:hypothetical protein
MHCRLLRQGRRQTLAAVVIALAICSSQAAASPREWQPLMVKGSQLTSLLGASTDHIEVVAIHQGTIKAVPFQIDELTGDGTYVLPEGPQATPNTQRTFNGDDEIAMMISDLGEKSTVTSWLPPGTLEIEMSDPLGGPNRYAYIAAAASPRRCDRRYVSFDPRTDTIETDHYRVALTNGLPTDFAMQTHIDEHAPNLIDRMKVRLSTLVIHLIRFSFSEDDIHSKVLAWKTGPIRVIRRLSHSVNLVLGMHSPVFERNDFFYRDHLENPFKMHLSWAPRIFFGDIRVRIDLDFNDLRGYELLWSGMAMPPLKIGNPEMERRIPPPGSTLISWIAIRGARRTAVQTLAPTPDLPLLRRQLYFNNDPRRPDPPERTPGEHPGIGYVITGWEKLESGVHTFDSLLITTPADYSPDVLLKELHNAAAVTVRPVLNRK